MACNQISLAYSQSISVCQETAFKTYEITGATPQIGMILYAGNNCTAGQEAPDGFYKYFNGTNYIWLSVLTQNSPLQRGVIQYSGQCYDCVSAYVSGIGTSYYYYDCCFNLIQGTTTSDFQQFTNVNASNPSLYPYSNSIVIINTQSGQICSSQTPTPTPTITPTITPTQTNTPTPTQTNTPTPSSSRPEEPPPFFSYQNNCDVYTSFPLGLRCNLIQSASTITSTDGILQVIASGGTTPYFYYWSNGGRTDTINNLSAGTYSVTVIDYYGDYTATTTCTVIAPQLECGLIGNASQIFSTPTPTPTQTQTPTMTPTQTQTPTPTATRPLKSFTIKAFGLNALRFGTWTNSNTTIVNWGDSSSDSYAPGTLTNTIEHIYATPYTGDITFSSLDLSTISRITITNTITGTTNSGLTFTTSEMTKLDGLTRLEFGPTTDPTTANSGNAYISGITSQLPRSLTYLDTNKNNLSGNVSDLPTGLTHTFIWGTNTLSGDSSGLPRPTGISYIAILGENTISGNVSGLPQNGTLSILSITGNNTLSGDTSGIPTGLTYCIIWGNNTISGDIANTPRNINSILSIEGNNTITGNTTGFPNSVASVSVRGNGSIRGLISDIPSSVQVLYLYGTSGISGLTSDFTPTMTEISLLGAYNAVSGNTSYLSTMTSLRVFQISGGTSPIEGDISNIPNSMRAFALYEGNTISGNTSSVTTKTALRSISLFGNNTVDGSLSDFPTNFLSSISFGGNNTITGYTSPHNWYNFMSDVKITNDISTYGFSATTIDDILIDLTGKTWVDNKIIELEYQGTTPPTAAGLAAYNALVGSGVTVSFVT